MLKGISLAIKLLARTGPTVAVWTAIGLLAFAITACVPTTGSDPFTFEGSIPVTGDLLYRK